MTLFADKSINIFSEKSIQKKYVFFIHNSYFLGRKKVTFPRLFELKVKNFVYVLYTSSKTQINRIMGSFKVRLIVLILYTFNGLVNIYFFSFLGIDIHIYRLGRFYNPTFSTSPNAYFWSSDFQNLFWF